MVVIHRRDVLAGTGALVGLGLAGCGRSEPNATDAGSSPTSGARTIEHEFGASTLSGTPSRVIALGVNDIDPILALGTTPIAAAGYRFYQSDDPVLPWAVKYVEGTPPQFITAPASEPNYEELASLNPDLIVAISSGIDSTGLRTAGGDRSDDRQTGRGGGIHGNPGSSHVDGRSRARSS